MPSHYDNFIEHINKIYTGFEFIHKNQNYTVRGQDIRPADFIRKHENPKTPLDVYLSTLEDVFIQNAKTEMYRSNSGWVERGIKEDKLIRFTHHGDTRILPKLNGKRTIGIDSSRTLFVVCCFDNVNAGIFQLERMNIPKDKKKDEYKWHDLNAINRSYIIANIEKILNHSCCGLFAINSNFINSNNHFRTNQFIALIEGCFAGYNHLRKERDELKTKYYNWCNNTEIHCDPDFGALKPPNIVRHLVRTLSKTNGKIDPNCTPLHATLRSDESLAIQLADSIVGSFSDHLHSNLPPPPFPCEHLLFNERYISKKDKRNGRWAKGYYWIRN